MKNFRKFAFVLCALTLCALVGCKNENQPVDPGKSEAIHGNVPKPEWKAPEKYDMTSSMTAIIKVDLSQKYAAQLDTAKYELKDEDLVAAFADEECLGVVSPKEGLFSLYICAPTVNTNMIVIRYYSASLMNIFEDQGKLTYQNDGRIGTPGAPYTPVLMVK